MKEAGGTTTSPSSVLPLGPSCGGPLLGFCINPTFPIPSVPDGSRPLGVPLFLTKTWCALQLSVLQASHTQKKKGHGYPAPLVPLPLDTHNDSVAPMGKTNAGHAIRPFFLRGGHIFIWKGFHISQERIFCLTASAPPGEFFDCEIKEHLKLEGTHEDQRIQLLKGRKISALGRKRWEVKWRKGENPQSKSKRIFGMPATSDGLLDTYSIPSSSGHLQYSMVFWVPTTSNCLWGTYNIHGVLGTYNILWSFWSLQNLIVFGVPKKSSCFWGTYNIPSSSGYLKYLMVFWVPTTSHGPLDAYNI